MKIFEPNKEKLFLLFKFFFFFSSSRPVALHSSNFTRFVLDVFFFPLSMKKTHMSQRNTHYLGVVIETTFSTCILSIYFHFCLMFPGVFVISSGYPTHTHTHTHTHADGRITTACLYARRDISRCFTFDWFHVRESHHARPSGSLSELLFFFPFPLHLTMDDRGERDKLPSYPQPQHTRRGEGNLLK